METMMMRIYLHDAVNDVDDSVDDEDSDLAVYLYTISFEAVSSKAQSNL